MLPSQKQSSRSSTVRLGAILGVLCLIASFVSVPRSAQAAAPAIQAKQSVPFTPTACPVPAPEGFQLDCGNLTVAESRRNYTGKTIQLAVAIVRSPNPNRAADPVIFLSGGPGQGAVGFAPYIPQIMGPILAQRDVILIDQRGTGFSQPSLTCSYGATTLNGQYPIGMKQADNRTELLQFQVSALKACGDRYRQAGIDLRAYNSVESAADLEDLRLALGIGQWNIYGGSYGSRLALTAMQYRPATLRSVAIESIYPLQANFHVDVFSSYNQTLTQLFADCAADLNCNAAYPNLGGIYDALIPQMNANPPQIPLIDLSNGEVITYLPVSGNDVSLVLFQLAYITQVIPILPSIIGETARGNYRILSILLSQLLLQQGEPTGGFSLGMQVAVQCNEDVTFASARDFVVARDTYRRAAPLAQTVTFNEALLDVCAAWGLTNQDPADNQPVRSDVPVLLINGTYDPITPPQYATAAAQTLSRSQVVIYPRGGHTPALTSPCLTGVMTSFYNNPAVSSDASCIAGEPPLPFEIVQ